MFALASCVSSAERETCEVIGPEYSAYVAADQRLTPDQRARRLRLVRSWQLAVGIGR